MIGFAGIYFDSIAYRATFIQHTWCLHLCLHVFQCGDPHVCVGCGIGRSVHVSIGGRECAFSFEKAMTYEDRWKKCHYYCMRS